MGLGAGPAHAVYFSVYEAFKKAFSGKTKNRNNPDAHAAAGVLATVASDADWRVAREEGVGAFYASYKTTVVMNAPYTAVHFATYEAVKKGLLLTEVSSERAGEEEGWAVHATAGAAAGALAAGVTTPLDVVKTQLQCQSPRWECLHFSMGSFHSMGGSKGKENGSYCSLLALAMRNWSTHQAHDLKAADSRECDSTESDARAREADPKPIAYPRGILQCSIYSGISSLTNAILH
ncbi:hypothetical protein RHGRI_002580 [Rhododendron griersonianum]|nr:hypothetical protein RHGRI_002580 [Rhododendron griersonianum]